MCFLLSHDDRKRKKKNQLGSLFFFLPRRPFLLCWLPLRPPGLCSCLALSSRRTVPLRSLRRGRRSARLSIACELRLEGGGNSAGGQILSAKRIVSARPLSCKSIF